MKENMWDEIKNDGELQETKNEMQTLSNEDYSGSGTGYATIPITERVIADSKEYLEAPYTYSMSKTESVSLNNGALQITETDFVIPGKNGFDLAMTRQYDSSKSNEQDQSPTPRSFSVPWQPTQTAVQKYKLRPSYMRIEHSGKPTGEGFDYLYLAYGIPKDKVVDTIDYLDKKYVKGKYYPSLTFYRLEGSNENVTMESFFKATLTTITKIEAHRHTTNNTGTGGGMPEDSIGPANMTDLRDNKHLVSQYGLGYGWGFVLPSIETIKTADEKKVTSFDFLHLSDGRCLKIRKNHSGLEAYYRDDVTYGILKNSSSIKDANRADVSYDSVVTYKNNHKDYFQKDADSGTFSLVARQDNLGNTIAFMLANGAMQITDSFGKVYSLGKSDGKLTWTLPDGGQIVYHTDGSQLTQVDRKTSGDSAQSTKYTYTRTSGNCQYYNVVGNVSPEIFYNPLTQITHPTGAVTSYSYTTLKQEIKNTPDGYRDYFAIASRKDICSGKDVNRITYSYPNNFNNKNELVKKTSITKVVVKRGSESKKTFEAHIFDPETSLCTQVAVYNKISMSPNDLVSEVTNQYYKKVGLIVAKGHGLLKKQSVSQRQPDLWQTNSKTTEWIYTSNYSGNVDKVIETYDKAPTMNQTTEYSYGVSSIVVEKSYTQNGIVITEQNTLDANKPLVVERKIFEGKSQKQRTVYEYSDTNNLIQQNQYVDASNCNKITYEYENFNSKPIKKKVADSFVDIFAYDKKIANLLEEVYTYDAMGRMLSKKDGEGRTTTYAYDNLGRVISEQHPDGAIKKNQYYDSSNQIIMTDENGIQTKYEYTSLGKLQKISTQNPEVILSSCTYNDQQLLETETTYTGTDSNIRAITSYNYDYLNRLIEKKANRKSPTGTELYKETYAYLNLCTEDNIYYSKETKIIMGGDGAESISLTCFKNILGYVCKEVAGDQSTSYTYDNCGNKLTQTDANGNTTSWQYDYAGHVCKETNALLDSAITSYDALGRKLSVKDFNGKETVFEYDAAGRLTKQTAPFSGEQKSNTIYTYDKVGNLKTQIVQCGKPGESATRISSHDYDSRNRVIKTISGDQGAGYKYDGVGNKLEIYHDAPYNSTSTNKTSYSYDRFNNVTCMIDARSNKLSASSPLYKTEIYNYDATGRINYKIDRNGNKTTYDHDELNRIKSLKVIDPSEKILDQVSTGYTKTGQKSSESNGVLTISYAYDAHGRLFQQTEGSVVKNYSYDKAGNRERFALNRNNVVELDLYYSYDKMNRLEDVRRHAKNTNMPSIAVYSYDKNGNRKKLSYPFGDIKVSYEYNDANLVTSLTNKHEYIFHGTKPTVSILSSFAYTYYLDGNQESKRDHTDKTTSYVYDRTGRLEKESVLNGESYSYKYDMFSNRSLKTTVSAAGKTAVTSYSYHPNNWLLEEKTVADKVTDTYRYQYDGNGNQVCRQWERLGAKGNPGKVGFGKPAGSTVLELREYGGFGNLEKIVKDGIATSYDYRPDGLRHSKSVGNDKAATVHFWDGSNIVAETSASVQGNFKARYYRGINLISQQIDANYFCYLHNAHGDVVQQFGGLVNRTPMYQYDAFGNQINENPNDPNPFRYCGEYFDSGSGEYYLRARYYNPAVGRFSSEDPIKSGLNWYTYCGGNPIRFIDPLGLAAVSFVDYLKAMGATVNEYNKNGDAYAKITYGDIIKNYKLNSGIMDHAKINNIFGWGTTLALGDKIISRDDWGALDLGTKWEVDQQKTEIVIHHTSSNKSVQEYDEQHNTTKQPFDGIGYHFMIDSDGNIYEGRPLDFKGAHVGGANTGKIGICLIGNFEPGFFRNNKPTNSQVSSMTMLVSEMQNVYSITDSNIGGHMDYALNSTVCPGKNLYSIIEEQYR